MQKAPKLVFSKHLAYSYYSKKIFTTIIIIKFISKLISLVARTNVFKLDTNLTPLIPTFQNLFHGPLARTSFLGDQISV